MSIRWHKYDVLFHLRGGQCVKLPALDLSTTRDSNGGLTKYSLTYPWRHSRQSSYIRLDAVDSIELRARGWWRWAW